MPVRLVIDNNNVLTITLTGLSQEDIALMQKLFLMSDQPTRPAFDLPAPGTFSVHGSIRQLRHCISRISKYTGVPAHIRTAIGQKLDNYLRSDYKLRCRDRVLDLGSRTHVMGILNVTPDSFSDGGRYLDPGRAIEHAKEMAKQGADIIDIGGESTRPGAEPLSEDEEIRRVMPVIERLRAEIETPISIDTYKSRVAEQALKAGASIINDISGLRFSSSMAKVAADYGAGLVIMHIKGTPRNMQQNPSYEDVISEVMDYLEEGIEIALKAGVDPEQIAIDPGIGFGKTFEHNLTILNCLNEFRILGRPILIGTSRKRFIGAVLDQPEPEQRIEGTAATIAIGIERGASIVRVHDVAYMARVAKMTDALIGKTKNIGC